MKLSLARMAIISAVLSVIPACSSLDLGPEPSDYVGQSRSGAESLTDQNLAAVVPSVPGDYAADDMNNPATTLPGQGTSAQTMPAATQPSTTQPTASTNPATHPALGKGSTANDAPGHTSVPKNLTVQEAILVGLQNNVNLRVQQLTIPLARTNEESQRAAFDPSISGQISGERARNPGFGSRTVPVLDGNGNPTGNTTVVPFPNTQTTENINGQLSVNENLPTGTKITMGYNTTNSFYSDASSSSGVSLDVTQSLLQGADINANLASLRESELSTKISQFELRGVAEDLVASIEETYWDVAFDERNILIVQNALDVGEALLNQTKNLIQVGRVSPTEEAASVAQVASERGDLINAKSTLEKDRLTLLRLITPRAQPFWDRTISLDTQPFVPVGKMDPVADHVKVGLEYRPEVNQTLLQIQQNDLEIVRTKNGLLPKLDLFVNLTKTGFASSFGVSNLNINGPDSDVVVGVTGSYDIVNRAEHAAYHAAQITREQTQEAFENLNQTVQSDVRTQYIEVERLRQQIDATKATREADQTSLDVETAKFKTGRSTAILVAQAQQNLLTAQLSEVQSVTNHLKALVELYRLEGSLLYRRGIAAPGAKPIHEIAWH